MKRPGGRAAIVTGAAGDIGRTITMRFAAEGPSVLCMDIDLEGAKRSAPAT